MLRVTVLGIIAIPLLVLALYRAVELVEMNRYAGAEARRLIAASPALAEQIGSDPKFGTVWRGSYDWWVAGGGLLEAYVPVHGASGSGVLYMKELDDAGVWKPRGLRFRSDTTGQWMDFETPLASLGLCTLERTCAGTSSSIFLGLCRHATALPVPKAEA